MRIRLAVFAVPLLFPLLAAGQASGLATRAGLELGGQLVPYRYEEPGFMSLAGARFGAVGAYTSQREGVFSRLDARASLARLRYEGSGIMNGVPDFILEGRAVLGTDYPAAPNLALAPYVGLGYRYLFNDLRGITSTGFFGYRRFSNYLYLPLGLTLRMRLGGQWIFAPTLEHDFLLRGWQITKASDLGTGSPDVTNRQSGGRGDRLNLMFESAGWTLGVWMHRWRVADSDCIPVSATECLYEPANRTRETGIEVRHRF